MPVRRSVSAANRSPSIPVAGHIPGAKCATFDANLGEDGCFRTPEELRKRFEGLFSGVTADRAINYCGSGVSACHNLLAIVHAGLGDAVLYPGSWSEWITDEVRPVGTERLKRVHCTANTDIKLVLN